MRAGTGYRTLNDGLFPPPHLTDLKLYLCLDRSEAKADIYSRVQPNRQIFK